MGLMRFKVHWQLDFTGDLSPRDSAEMLDFGGSGVL
jgi:hypothetical protein